MKREKLTEIRKQIGEKKNGRKRNIQMKSVASQFIHSRSLIALRRHGRLLSTDSEKVHEPFKVDDADTVKTIPPSSTEKLLVLSSVCGLSVSSLSRSARSSIHDYWANKVAWYHGNLLSPKSLKETHNGVTAVVNGTANINAIRAASEQAIGVKRFVYISAVDFGLANYLLQGYYEGKKAAETELQIKFPYGGVIMRRGFIYGTRSFGSMKLPLGVIGSPLEAIILLAEDSVVTDK